MCFALAIITRQLGHHLLCYYFFKKSTRFESGNWHVQAEKSIFLKKINFSDLVCVRCRRTFGAPAVYEGVCEKKHR